jgi:uncharacterized Zn finger protein (UPF0148 family)
MSPPEDIPEDREWSTSCPECERGIVSVNKDGDFECNNCDFLKRKPRETYDKEEGSGRKEVEKPC